jgi:hypothetical protein
VIQRHFSVVHDAGACVARRHEKQEKAHDEKCVVVATRAALN